MKVISLTVIFIAAAYWRLHESNLGPLKDEKNRLPGIILLFLYETDADAKTNLNALTVYLASCITAC